MLAESVAVELLGDPSVSQHDDARAHGEEIALVDESPLSQDELLETALGALADEIRHLLDEGVVPTAADVDTALILGAGFPFWLGGITKHLEQLGISERMAS